MPPKSLMKELFSGMFPAWRSPKVSDTSPAVVPNLMRVEPMSEPAEEAVPYSAVTKLLCRHVSSVGIDLLCGGSSESNTGGATSEAVALSIIVVVLVVAVDIELCFVVAWFSEKPCLLIAVNEGSLSVPVVGVGSGGGAVAVDVVGVCGRWPLLLLLWFL